jgi:hypothetical protein
MRLLFGGFGCCRKIELRKFLQQGIVAPVSARRFVCL